MRRGGIREPPVLLRVLAVVSLRSGQAEDALLQDRVAAVPECEGQAEALVAVADAGQAVLVPAVGAGPGVIVGQVLPRRSARRVVLAHRAPGALRQVRAPESPRERVGHPS